MSRQKKGTAGEPGQSLDFRYLISFVAMSGKSKTAEKANSRQHCIERRYNSYKLYIYTHVFTCFEIYSNSSIQLHALNSQLTSYLLIAGGNPGSHGSPARGTPVKQLDM